MILPNSCWVNNTLVSEIFHFETATRSPYDHVCNIHLLFIWYYCNPTSKKYWKPLKILVQPQEVNINHFPILRDENELRVV